MKTLNTLLLALLLCSIQLFAQTRDEQHAILDETLIFPQQEKHTHGSSLVALPNGDMLAVWFQGSGERSADDVKLMGARLVKGQKEWTTPFEMADTKGIPDCNPVLFLNKNNKLFLVWIAVLANHWENSILRVRTSSHYNTNGAPQWDWQDDILFKPDYRFAQEVARKFKDLPENTQGWGGYAPKYDDMIIDASKDLLKRSIGWQTRIHPIILASGRILLPLYSDGLNMSLVAISDDDGESWLPSLPIVGRGPIQPSLAVKKNGQIVAFMRDSGDAPPRVQRSVSDDNGETWSAAVKTDIPNTASVELEVLQDGHWAFLGNDEEDGRYRLTLMISNDEGETWPWKEHIENVNPGEGGFSYPCLIQTNDGLLHMTYSYDTKEGQSIKYVVIDPNKITR